MEKFFKSILYDLSPCSIAEIYDYIHSDLFYIRGNISSEDLTMSKIRYELERLVETSPQIFKFHCKSGYKIRYGLTKFRYYLPNEARFLKVKGYIKRCMFCGMPIYIEEDNLFHFKYKCKQYHPQDHFQLVKIQNLWAIISHAFIHGLLDNLHSAVLRLPEGIKNKTPENISEWWLVNKIIQKKGYIEKDKFLPVRGEEFIA